ncbi:phage scaffolding protein [Christensenella intestinihominis]|uniref:phage scaffolding protein n=1 Tax=Christensenella intestinihominis TaxID=1851429 RepID=UPI00082A3844|nr:phage scaffolding protein [Christensenella intestinihominis]
MKREFLKELGIEDGAIDKIMAENGKDVEAVKAKAGTDEAALAAKDAEIKSLSGQLSAANEQIEGFKKLDVEGIKKASDDWKQKAEDAEKDRDNQIAAIKFDHALGAKLADIKAKDPDILMKLINKDNLKLTDDGNILGLDEQISKIKEEKEFLFEPEKATPKIVAGGTGGGGNNDDIAAARAVMGLPPEK